mmetsp:Transcript_18385/g.41860  ORF Transcript_18385/g.41860 Transcript_18385/m.41860 type:complete len:231 (-) Transcript_18385:74-766(-)
MKTPQDLLERPLHLESHLLLLRREQGDGQENSLCGRQSVSTSVLLHRHRSELLEHQLLSSLLPLLAVEVERDLLRRRSLQLQLLLLLGLLLRTRRRYEEEDTVNDCLLLHSLELLLAGREIKEEANDLRSAWILQDMEEGLVAIRRLRERVRDGGAERFLEESGEDVWIAGALSALEPLDPLLQLLVARWNIQQVLPRHELERGYLRDFTLQLICVNFRWYQQRHTECRR